jgi:hypothetical protein
MSDDRVVLPGPMSISSKDKNHANFRELRNAWEEKSISSSMTKRVGNREGDNNEWSRMQQLLPVKDARWDRDETPILAWQREWQIEKRLAGGGLYPILSSTWSSHSSYSSSSSSSLAGDDDDIEEEAKRKLSAFLSKPSGLNWEDLVRSLASNGRRRKGRKGGSRASSPPAPMLNKIITVVSHLDNNYEDDEISAMGEGDETSATHRRRRGSQRHARCRGEEKLEEGEGGGSENEWGNEDGCKGKRSKRRDRLERMIEGVVTGKIAVDVKDVAQKKVSQVVSEGSSPRLLEERGQHQQAGETTQGDYKVNGGENQTTPPRADGDNNAAKKYDIPSPPKRISLLALGSSLSPIRSRSDRAVGRTESIIAHASKKTPVYQSTPHTCTTSSSTMSSPSSRSCSDGGWSSHESETDEPPTSEMDKDYEAFLRQLVFSKNDPPVDRERHERQHHHQRDRGVVTMGLKGGPISMRSRGSPSNVEMLNATQSFITTTSIGGKFGVDLLDNDTHAAFISIPDDSARIAARVVSSERNAQKETGVPLPQNNNGKNPPCGRAVQNIPAAECFGVLTTSTTTFFAINDIAVAKCNNKGGVPSTSEPVMMMTTNTTADLRKFDTMALKSSWEGCTKATVHKRILLRPESLLLNARHPTYWELIRHRISKTRGEF